MLRITLTALSLALAGATPALAADQTDSNSVTILNYAFKPQTVTVKKGASVTWTNKDESPHTVSTETKAFRSPALDTGETYSHTFDQVGSFTYFCSLHPQMTGTVVVTP